MEGLTMRWILIFCLMLTAHAHAGSLVFGNDCKLDDRKWAQSATEGLYFSTRPTATPFGNGHVLHLWTTKATDYQACALETEYVNFNCVNISLVSDDGFDVPVSPNSIEYDFIDEVCKKYPASLFNFQQDRQKKRK